MGILVSILGFGPKNRIKSDNYWIKLIIIIVNHYVMIEC